MKKLILFSLVACLFSTVSIAQTEAEKQQILEDVNKEMQQLQLDLADMMKELQTELSNMEIDLSGLDELSEIDWEEYVNDEEALAYFDSDAFRQEMDEVQKEVARAMEEVKEELKRVENIDIEEVNREIEEAMKEVERELSQLKEKDKDKEK
ncbi:MAG: hypothetical protein KDC34_17150 [Saprospiraceae bacterium]|nr:hypothetical protein [Saprospiraceae bacterium]